MAFSSLLSELPFSNEDFGTTFLNLYFSSPTTVNAIMDFFEQTSMTYNRGGFEPCVKKGFCDLGCGDGRVAIAMAQRFNIPCIGIDSSPAHISLAIELAQAAGVSSLCSFVLADISKYKIPSSVGWVTAYLPKFILDHVRLPVLEWMGTGVGDEKLFASILYTPTGWEDKECAKDEIFGLWMFDKRIMDLD